MQSKYEFHINGMHCKSCSLFIENTISEDKAVSGVKVDFSNSIISVEGDFGNETKEKVASYLTGLVFQRGYTLTLQKEGKTFNTKEILLSIMLGISIIFAFVMLQRLGLINLLQVERVTFSSAFLIGVIASLSSCLVVVGGISIALSIGRNKKEILKTQLKFQLSRIISFAVLGGMLGLVGSSFKIGLGYASLVNLVVGIMLLIVGINSLGVTSVFQKLQLSLPKNIFKHAQQRAESGNVSIAPLILGAATFFMPCGFTQSLQFYSLTTGSFISSSSIMFGFALGTVPILLALSFGSALFKEGKISTLFGKTAAVVLIGFSLINIISSLTALGYIKPIFNF